MGTFHHYFVHRTTSKRSKVIMHGNINPIANKLGIQAQRIRKAIRENDGILDDKYFVERMKTEDYIKQVKRGGPEDKPMPIPKETKRSKFKERIKLIEWILDKHGNTIIYKDVDRVKRALEKDGYIVDFDHRNRVDRKDTDSEMLPERWIITLIKKEKK